MSTVNVVRTRWSSDEGDRFTVDDPATGRPLAVVQGTDAAGVDSAMRAAAAAQPSWARRTSAERGGYLAAAAGMLREHAEELARLEATEVGKPFSQALSNDLPAAISILELFAGLVHDLPSSARSSATMLDVTTLKPYGVIAGIIPFNWPPIHAAGKIAPALAAGNAVVIKPPEQAPLTILRLVELLQEVLPDDVLHVVPGGAATGSALAGHPLVGKLTFTGAPTTGAIVLKSVADNLTPTVMELGGKNALIVFADADLDAAVAAAIDGGFFNNGEACTAASRVLVERTVHDTFLDAFATAVGKLRVGAPLAEGIHVGPLVTAAQQRRVLDYISVGEQEGARVAARAELPVDPDLAGGFFVAPTVFADVQPGMRIASEEIFGPVVTVLSFDTEQEAVAIANDTEFGLFGAVFTRDATRAVRVADALQVGVALINNYERNTAGSPFGGVKHSGFGREHAKETLAEYGYSKTVRLPLTPLASRWGAVADVLGN